MYSHGGHLIAAVTGNIINLYSSITYENVAILKGHIGQIKSISWSHDDKKLISAGADGVVYTWSMETFARLDENVNKGFSYTNVLYNHSGTDIILSSIEGTLRHLVNGNLVSDISVSNEMFVTSVSLFYINLITNLTFYY